MKPKTKLVTVLSSILVITIILTLAIGLVIGDPSKQKNTGLAIQNLNIQQGYYPASTISSLSSTQMVQDLPKGALVELKLGESFYTIQKNSITQGKPSNPDIAILLPVSYAKSLTSNFCETIKKANQNGDLSIQTYLSKTSLAWKYRSMLKYRDCLN